MLSYVSKLWWLLVAHAMTDYVWQTEAMGRYKSRRSDPPDYLGPWWWHLAAHGLINGGAVAWVTGNLWLGMAEFCVHCSLDFMKCEGMISAKQDQAGHVVSKLVWALA